MSLAASGKAAGSVATRCVSERSLELGGPEGGHRREDTPLVGYGFGEHLVEGRDPVRSHHQQKVVAGVEDVADLAGVQRAAGSSRHLLERVERAADLRQ